MTYDDRQKFEHELINRPIQWFLSSQSFLLAISAFARTSKFLTIVIAVLGIATALLTFYSVYMGIWGKRKNYEITRARQLAEKDEKKLLEYENFPLEWGVKTEITKRIMIADMLIPVVFVLAWVAILVWRSCFYTSLNS